MCVYVRPLAPVVLTGCVDGHISVYVRLYARDSAQNLSTYMVL